jgi:hypothetical protein
MVSCRFSLKPIHWEFPQFWASSSRRGSHGSIHQIHRMPRIRSDHEPRNIRLKHHAYTVSIYIYISYMIYVLHIINHIYIYTYIYIYIHICVCVLCFKGIFFHPKRDSASRSWTIPTWVWAWRRIRWLGDSMRNHSPTPLNQGRDSTRPGKHTKNWWENHHFIHV